MKKLLFLVLLLIARLSIAQSAIILGEESPGIYAPIKSTSGVLQIVGTVTPASVDPCQSSAIVKSSVAIAISTATTAALVAVSGSTTVYICSFTLSISQVITTANTIKFIQGTGAACSGAPADLTGAFGTGGVLAAAPLIISNPGGFTLFKTAASNGLCATTTIGASGSFQGVLTYVQQ